VVYRWQHQKSKGFGNTPFLYSMPPPKYLREEND